MEGIASDYDQSNMTVYIESDGAFDSENSLAKSPWRRLDRYALVSPLTNP